MTKTELRRRQALMREKNQTPKTGRRKSKPLEYERHGDKCYIQLLDSQGTQHVWIIPSDWIGTVKRIWPVHIRFFSSGKPYVARNTPVRSRSGNKTARKSVAIHRLFLELSAVRHEPEDNLEVETRDGNWLNYCDNNLYLRGGSDFMDQPMVSLSSLNLDTLWI